MSNPWLSVPLADYEGHMKSAEVQQLSALADLFADAIALCRPASIAILGIAGGNGLDRIDGDITTRVIGLDVNPLYLDTVRRRYSRMQGLELHCLDLAEQAVHLEPVQLVHAALVFEHAGVGRCLESAMSLVAPGGTLSAVLQLPSETTPSVGAGGFPSMQNLGPHFSLVNPIGFREALEAGGFQLVRQSRRPVPGGKAFWMGIFHRRQ